MSKKLTVLNGSPRKNFNTAKLLKESQRGAESVGAEVEYFNLYDYNFLGCRSCFACQRKGSTTEGVCAIKDDIRPILEKCINADAIIIGTTILGVLLFSEKLTVLQVISIILIIIGIFGLKVFSKQ